MRQSLIKSLLLLTGLVSVALGVLGIFLPLLPTTPFILLAGFCFARSSQRFHDWLLNHPWFGEILRTYQAGLGIEPRIRNRTLMIMWLGMFISMLIVNRLWSVFLLTAIGLAVSVYLLRLPEYRKPEAVEDAA